MTKEEKSEAASKAAKARWIGRSPAPESNTSVSGPCPPSLDSTKHNPRSSG
jgi:hypothetical protein